MYKNYIPIIDIQKKKENIFSQEREQTGRMSGDALVPSVAGPIFIYKLHCICKSIGVAHPLYNLVRLFCCCPDMVSSCLYIFLQAYYFCTLDCIWFNCWFKVCPSDFCVKIMIYSAVLIDKLHFWLEFIDSFKWPHMTSSL